MLHATEGLQDSVLSSRDAVALRGDGEVIEVLSRSV
jgi:hypothetical protein